MQELFRRQDSLTLALLLDSQMESADVNCAGDTVPVSLGTGTCRAGGRSWGSAFLGFPSPLVLSVLHPSNVSTLSIPSS